MTGKGWFVIYAILLVALVMLIIGQISLNRRVGVLEKTAKTVASPILSPGSWTAPSPQVSDAAAPETPESRDAIRKADITSLRAAVLAYRNAKKTLPTDLKQLLPTYLDQLPADPLDPKYTYRYRKTGAQTFAVTSVLENPNDPEDAKDGDHKKDGIYTLTDK